MLTVSDLTFRMQGRLLLDQTSLAISMGARVGFVGRNGTGKTTLFKMITGEYGPETGTIKLRRNMRIGQVAQEAPGSGTSLLDTVLEADVERAELLKEAETAQDPSRIADIHTRLGDINAHSAEARAGGNITRTWIRCRIANAPLFRLLRWMAHAGRAGGRFIF